MELLMCTTLAAPVSTPGGKKSAASGQAPKKSRHKCPAQPSRGSSKRSVNPANVIQSSARSAERRGLEVRSAAIVRILHLLARLQLFVVLFPNSSNPLTCLPADAGPHAGRGRVIIARFKLRPDAPCRPEPTPRLPADPDSAP